MSGADIVFESVGLIHPGGVQALRDVSFGVPAGAICAVLGPSGAGKSTLLRAINGLAAPTSGRIRVGGEVAGPHMSRALRPRIAMIHQAGALVARSSVAANVAAGALPSISAWRAAIGVFPRDVQKRACELVAAVGLDQAQIARRVDQLSGGQQQRVGVARAFMAKPSVVLADEPVANLDPCTARQIVALICAEGRATGATVLCSLHQLELAREFADHVIALREGRLTYAGRAAAFWADDAAARALYEAA